MKKESDLGKDPATKLDEFLEKCQGGGVIFNPKISVADFGKILIYMKYRWFNG